MLFKKKLASKVYFSKFIQIKKLAKEKKGSCDIENM